MKKSKFSKELIVGATGALALLLIYLLINFFKGIDLFKDGELYYVKFDNIGQIVSSSPVYLNGYKAGNVREISYDFENMKNVIVAIDIDKRLKIPVGSYAEVSNHMLGGSEIGIILSDNNNFISAGDTIVGRLNKGLAGEMGSAIPTINNMIPKVDSILTSLNTILANPALNASINNIGQLTSDLNSTTEHINALLSRDIPQITERMVKIENDILKVSSQLTETDYKKLLSAIAISVDNLESITTALERGEGTAGKLLKDNELYNKLDSTCSAAKALLEDLKENPKRYVHFSIFGRKQQ